MKPKEKAMQHIRTEGQWIVLHKQDTDTLISEETSYHSSFIVEEAIELALGAQEEEFEKERVAIARNQKLHAELDSKLRDEKVVR